MENKSEGGGGGVRMDVGGLAQPGSSHRLHTGVRLFPCACRPTPRSTLLCVLCLRTAVRECDVKHVRLCRRVLHFSATFLRLTGPRAFGATQEQTQETQLAGQLGDGTNLFIADYAASQRQTDTRQAHWLQEKTQHNTPHNTFWYSHFLLASFKIFS